MSWNELFYAFTPAQSSRSSKSVVSQRQGGYLRSISDKSYSSYKESLLAPIKHASWEKQPFTALPNGGVLKAADGPAAHSLVLHNGDESFSVKCSVMQATKR